MNPNRQYSNSNPGMGFNQNQLNGMTPNNQGVVTYYLIFSL
jgi:hypothetical protein